MRVLRTHDGLHRARTERDNLRGDKARATAWIWVAKLTGGPFGVPDHGTAEHAAPISAQGVRVRQTTAAPQGACTFLPNARPGWPDHLCRCRSQSFELLYGREKVDAPVSKPGALGGQMPRRPGLQSRLQFAGVALAKRSRMARIRSRAVRWAGRVCRTRPGRRGRWRRQGRRANGVIGGLGWTVK